MKICSKLTSCNYNYMPDYFPKISISPDGLSMISEPSNMVIQVRGTVTRDGYFNKVGMASFVNPRVKSFYVNARPTSGAWTDSGNKYIAGSMQHVTHFV